MSRKGRHIEVFQAANGAWYSPLIGGNGETMRPSEGYSGRNGKAHAIRAANDAFPGVPIWILDDEGNSVLLRPEAEVLAGPGPLPPTPTTDG